MDFALKNKVVFLTGSSAGIGRAAAIAFGREGASVAVTYHQNLNGAEETAEHVEKVGGQAMICRYDISDRESIRDAVGAVTSQWECIDVLVNNAVRWPSSKPPSGEMLFESLSPQIWQPAFDNITGAYATIQAVLPSMRRKNWGRIVNISSNLAEDGVPGAGPYASAKSALHGLTAVLAAELAPSGILVNVVMPGMTATERGMRLRPREVNDRIAQLTPTKRLTTPEDVANLIVFLASGANGHVNGEMIRVSGGL